MAAHWRPHRCVLFVPFILSAIIHLCVCLCHKYCAHAPWGITICDGAFLWQLYSTTYRPGICNTAWIFVDARIS